MTKLFFILLLTGCGWSIGLIGEPGKAATTNQSTPQYTPGKGYQCTTDEQCGDEAVCYKATESYVGVCSKVQK